MPLYSSADCTRIADDHRRRARESRAMTNGYVPADPEYGQLMRSVGFHKIQADLWDKSATLARIEESR